MNRGESITESPLGNASRDPAALVTFKKLLALDDGEMEKAGGVEGGWRGGLEMDGIDGIDGIVRFADVKYATLTDRERREGV